MHIVISPIKEVKGLKMKDKLGYTSNQGMNAWSRPQYYRTLMQYFPIDSPRQYIPGMEKAGEVYH